eukprot:GILI01002683.1.p1 GENE.GILI01002683.1~~GILI01002683.1.p1  ORF type:complete len:241 (+),score=79.86 GILI01002683.1:75-797(+)
MSTDIPTFRRTGSNRLYTHTVQPDSPITPAIPLLQKRAKSSRSLSIAGEDSSDERERTDEEVLRVLGITIDRLFIIFNHRLDIVRDLYKRAPFKLAEGSENMEVLSDITYQISSVVYQINKAVFNLDRREKKPIKPIKEMDPEQAISSLRLQLTNLSVGFSKLIHLVDNAKKQEVANALILDMETFRRMIPYLEDVAVLFSRLVREMQNMTFAGVGSIVVLAARWKLRSLGGKNAKSPST